MRYARWALLLAVGCALGVGAKAPVRPACTADNAGRFWPEEANDHPQFAVALMPYGYPEVCALRDGKYAWRSLTVSLKQLRRERTAKSGKKPSGK